MSLDYYGQVWYQFGYLSHYAADLSSPLHSYSVSIDGVYHEGDNINGEWVNGLWEYGLWGQLQHWSTELAMGTDIDYASSNITPMDPFTAATKARATLNNYNSLSGNGGGFQGMMKDFNSSMSINSSFFISIGAEQANNAIATIKYVWNQALNGYTPPQNCPDPPLPVGCGDCTDGSTCPPPGGDHPDDTNSVATASTPQTSEELLSQAWDRLAVKKAKTGLINPWMRRYFVGEYESGGIDDAIYQNLSQPYRQNSSLADSTFYNDYITSPDVAILGRGFALAMSDMCQDKFHEPVRRFTVEDFTPDAITDYPVFVVPSGGLGGMEALA